MFVPMWVWLVTLAAVLAMLAVDMLAHRGPRGDRGTGMRVAALWSATWVGLGVGFGFVVWAAWGASRAGQYFGGYLLEKSLSVDNIAVLALIFSSFAVPPALRHRVLFFGVVGALAMRGALIAAGIALISQFQWVLYVFGGFLLVTAWRMLRAHKPGGALIARLVPATTEYHGARFLTRRAGRLRATPLLVVLVLIELADLVFAVDSIPAVLSVTDEPFLVFTSNAFAILGMRALYSLLDGLLHRFVYLRPALAVILAFAGLKMLLADIVHIPVAVSLAFIVACLGAAALASSFAGRMHRDLR